MSGILAILNHNEQPVSDTVLAPMLARISRHGPDSQAYMRENHLALAHTLLATTRESYAEKQPAYFQENSVWIAADARIDDRDNLITKLRQHGHKLDSDITDDRLILSAYCKWGINCLDHLIGDFAFVLWDERNRNLIAATDQFGVCPLYYAAMEQSLSIANDVTCLRLHPEVSDTLNEQTVGDYLMYRMNHEPTTTIFRDIARVPPGHVLTFHAGQLCVRRYHTPPEPNHQRRRNEAELTEEFTHLFDTAVSDRLRADCAGAHVSGGMDSTSITAVLAELQKAGKTKSVQTYTQALKNAELNLDESFAVEVAKYCGVPIEIMGKDAPHAPVTPENLSPEPSFINREGTRYAILAHSAKTARTFFSGFGGDPLLAPDVSYWHNLLSGGQWLTYGADVLQFRKLHGHLISSMTPWHYRRNQTLKRTAVNSEKMDWLQEDFRARNRIGQRIAEQNEALVNLNDQRNGMFTAALWRRIFEWQSPPYSDSHIRMRHPFFDMRLVNWSQTIPSPPWFFRKYLLRQIMKGRLPQSVLQRKKTGLAANPLVLEAAENQLPEHLRENALKEEIFDYINQEKIRHKLDNPEHLKADEARAIVKAATLGHWLSHYRNIPRYKTASLDRYVLRKP